MIYRTPDPQPDPGQPADTQDAPRFNRQHAAIAATALLVAGWIGYNMGGGDQVHARGTQSHTLTETATLNNGTALQILDIREERELTATNTAITLRYTAGNSGHHPTYELPTLTANGETHQPDTGLFITTSKGLDEPLAPRVEKEIKIGYKVPIHTLTTAQLNIDGTLFVGDFTERIETNGQ